MIYINIPVEKPHLRAVAKRSGALYNSGTKLWELDKKTVRRSLKPYVVFNPRRRADFTENIFAKRKRTEVVITQTLSIKELNFINHYLHNSFNAKDAAASAGYSASYGSTLLKNLMKKPSAQKMLMCESLKEEDRVKWDFDEKLGKLKQIVDVSMPNDALSIEDVRPSYAISAIAEANKMQGHYAPEKSVNLNLSGDLATAKDLMDRIKAREVGY